MGMNHADNLIKAKSATQYIFLICGIALSTWAIMVPFVKERLHLNDARLGMLMLLLGVGAMLTMPITGIFIQRLGSRRYFYLCW
jgi:MFS-type transporter involved in bile tolerance (Atg22 family)